MSEGLDPGSDAMQAFERKLAAISPAATGLRREEVLFEAGRGVEAREVAAARRRVRFWQSACAMVLVVSGLGMLTLRPVKTVEVVKYVPAPAAPGALPPPVGVATAGWARTATEARQTAGYLGLRDLTLSTGMLMLGGGAGRGGHEAVVQPLSGGEGLEALSDWQQRALGAGHGQM